MTEQSNELKKLATIAADLELATALRTKSIELIGSIVNHDALHVLLNLAANRELIKEESNIALEYAREIIESRR